MGSNKQQCIGQVCGLCGFLCIIPQYREDRLYSGLRQPSSLCPVGVRGAPDPGLPQGHYFLSYNLLQSTEYRVEPIQKGYHHGYPILDSPPYSRWSGIAKNRFRQLCGSLCKNSDWTDLPSHASGRHHGPLWSVLIGRSLIALSFMISFLLRKGNSYPMIQKKTHRYPLIDPYRMQHLFSLLFFILIFHFCIVLIFFILFYFLWKEI